MKKDYYKDLKTTSAPDSELILEGEIPFEVLKVEYDKIYKIAKNTVEIPGFRAGKAPEHLVKANLNDLALLDKAAEEVFKSEYPEMIDHLKLFPIDRPKIEILKLAFDNPLGFKITVAIMPKIELPDYKKIVAAQNKTAGEAESTDVTEKDIDNAVEEVRKMWAHQEFHKHNKEHKANESFDHLLPEINDEFVKTLGDFKDVADLRSKLKHNIAQEKKTRQTDKKRLGIIEALVKEFSVELPKMLVESELDKMIADLNNRLSSAGMTPTEYYKQIGKTEADLRTEWWEDAKKRAKTEIILIEISKKESIKPEKETVDTETKHLTDYYKDADADRARTYVEHMLTNEKVFEFLEKL